MASEFVIVQNMVQSVIKCVYFLEEKCDKVGINFSNTANMELKKSKSYKGVLALCSYTPKFFIQWPIELFCVTPPVSVPPVLPPLYVVSPACVVRRSFGVPVSSLIGSKTHKD